MRGISCVSGLALLVLAAVAAPDAALAQLGPVAIPDYEDDILGCDNPELIQARVVVDILTTQLADAKLQLAMHAANRAEALRRPDPDADYIARMEAEIAADMPRVAFLEEKLNCWRQRYDDLVAGRDGPDPGEGTGGEVLAEDPNGAGPLPAIDPADLAALAAALDAMLAATAEYQRAMEVLQAATSARAEAQIGEDTGTAPDGPAEDVAIGPEGGPIHAVDVDPAAEARADAADSLDAIAQWLSGPLNGAMVGATVRSK